MTNITVPSVKAYFLFFMLAPTVCFAGCVPNTPALVRENPAKTSTIVVARNYQAVYKELKEELSRCYQRGSFSATKEVRGELYTEMRQAELSVGLYGGMVDLYLVVDIEGLGANDSRVTSMESIKARTRFVKGYIPFVEGFLTTDAPMCKIKS